LERSGNPGLAGNQAGFLVFHFLLVQKFDIRILLSQWVVCFDNFFLPQNAQK
jgi:hypothetical protein